MTPRLSVNLIVRNGARYLRPCLEAVAAQTERDFELIVLDNASTDATRAIVRQYPLNGLPLKLVEQPVNLATWGGFEESLKHTAAPYAVLLSVDVLLDKDFLKHALVALETDDRVGAVQGKIKQWHFHNGAPERLECIDTTGFQIFRSRRLINRGHGEPDRGQYDRPEEIFAVEGAVPVFRRAALEDVRLLGEIVDHDMFWYGDDLDLTWRQRLLGWKQLYVPLAVAWHDRSTTKSAARRWTDYFARIAARRRIPIHKRRLDWRNYRLALVKNDNVLNCLRDLPRILLRELAILGYALLFEPAVLLEVPAFFRLLPRMLKKRKALRRRARVTPAALRRWFN